MILRSMQESRAWAFPKKEESVMLTSWRSFLLLLVVASASAMAQDASVIHPLPMSEDNQRLIDRLKETPVNQFEPGLPDESFDSWFSRLVKPKRVEYEVSESRER